jgi:guanylate kinase
MKIFVLIGPPSSGKSALMDYLLLNDSDYLEPIVSYTTRNPKLGEKEGKNYYFITPAQYTDYLVKNEIIEEIKYLENSYGITRTEIKRVQATGRNGLAILNLEGLRMLKKVLGSQNIVSIFIYRDLREILENLKKSCSGDEYEKRVTTVKEEMKDIGTSDYVVYNIGSLADAYQQMHSIIRKEINAPPIDRSIEPGQRYRHFKGDLYEVITTALHSENYCPLVVYKNLSTGDVFARPYDMFCGKKELESQNRIVNRFELVEEKEDQSESPDFNDTP